MHRKLDDAAIERIIGALQAGADMALAAKLVGCSRQSLYQRRAKDPAFAERIDEARAIADERVVNALFTAATGGNVLAQIFWLKNRRPHEWRDRREIQHDLGMDIRERMAAGRKRARLQLEDGNGSHPAPDLVDPSIAVLDMQEDDEESVFEPED